METPENDKITIITQFNKPTPRQEQGFIDDKQQYLRQQASHNLNVIQMIGDFCNRQPIYYDKNKIWWVWNKEKFKWEITDEIDIINALRYTFDLIGWAKSDIQSQVLSALKMVARDRKPQDAPITWVQFGSKIIDIETDKEFLATPEYFLTNPIPYKPSDNTETPTIDKLFSDWVGAEYIPTLYEIIAYCCYREYTIHRLFCLTGTGLNGKGTYLRLVDKIIGKDNVCSAELDFLLSNRFAVASLHKKTACFMGETNFNQLKNTSILKKLTGNDKITFEFKNKNPFDDYNYAKIIICTNTIPTTTDKTDGFYRRWLIIDFPNRFTEKKDILKDIPEQEYNNLSRKIIIILQELLKKREFTSEGTIEDRKQRFEEKSNPLSKFLQVYTEKNTDKYIFKYEFEETFTSFLKDNGYRTLTKNEINTNMRSEGYEEDKRYHTKADGSQSQYWVWLDITWKDFKVHNPNNPRNPILSTQFTHIEKRIENAGFSGFVGLSEEKID